MTANGDGVSFQGKNVMILGNGDDAQLCEYTKNH